MHVNTVAQRLDRIGVLLGADWAEPGRALELQLALRLRLGARLNDSSSSSSKASSPIQIRRPSPSSVM